MNRISRNDCDTQINTGIFLDDEPDNRYKILESDNCLLEQYCRVSVLSSRNKRRNYPHNYVSSKNRVSFRRYRSSFSKIKAVLRKDLGRGEKACICQVQSDNARKVATCGTEKESRIARTHETCPHAHIRHTCVNIHARTHARMHTRTYVDDFHLEIFGRSH